MSLSRTNTRNNSTKEQAGKATGNSRPKIVATYDYTDEAGALLYQVVRFEPKDFRQRRTDEKGGWTWNLKETRRVLYHLPQLTKSMPDSLTFVVEGEKDVHSLEAIGLLATTNAMGAGKWVADYNNFLRGRPVVILPDNDNPGREHGQTVAKALCGVADSVKIVELPGLPAKGDVSDWLKIEGNDKKKLLELVGGTAPVQFGDMELEQTGQKLPAGKSKAHSEEPAPQVQTFSAAELLAMVLPEPKWAIPDIVAEGLNILAGKPKLGKSWLALHLALAVAHGGVALGQIGVDAGDVLYLSLEDSRRRLKARLKTLLTPNNAPAPDRLTLATSWPRLDKGGLWAILEWLSNHPAARLVVIDTLAKIRPTRTRSGDRYEEDYQDVGELKALADKYGVAVIVVHHVRKMDAADPVDAVSGTLGLTGAADGVMVLKRERGQHDATLFITGRDTDEQELALRWDPEFALWSILGEAKQYRVTKERQEIIDLLAKTGQPLTPTEAATRLEKKVPAMKTMLWRMAEDGQITRAGEGCYTSNPGIPE